MCLQIKRKVSTLVFFLSAVYSCVFVFICSLRGLEIIKIRVEAWGRLTCISGIYLAVGIQRQKLPSVPFNSFTLSAPETIQPLSTKLNRRKQGVVKREKNALLQLQR